MQKQDIIDLSQYQEAPKESLVSKIANWGASNARAAVQGGQLGVMDFGSTLQKAVSPYTQGFANAVSPTINKGLNAAGIPLQVSAMTPQTAQSDYDRNVVDTQNNPDVQAHPISSIAGRLSGNLAMQAPLISAMGPGAAALPEGGALMGSLSGLTMNQPGSSPNQVVHPANALVGGVVGAAGSLVQKGVGNYLSNISQQSVNAVNKLINPSKEVIGLSQNMVAKATNPYTGLVDVSKAIVENPTANKTQRGLFQGLADVILPYLKNYVAPGGAAGTIGGLVGYAVDGPEGAYKGANIGTGLFAAGKVIAASPAVIKNMLSYSPLRNTLLGINKLGSNLFSNPAIATYKLNQLNQHLSTLGVDVVLQNSGEVELRSNTEKNRSIKPNPQSTIDLSQYR